MLHACGVQAVCASVCVWNALSECVMLLVCRPGVSVSLSRLITYSYMPYLFRFWLFLSVILIDGDG